MKKKAHKETKTGRDIIEIISFALVVTLLSIFILGMCAFIILAVAKVFGGNII